MRFHLQTLGCKINQYESQSLREAWLARGWTEVQSVREAEVVLVHTCAVTAGAVADSRGAVRRAGREAPGAAVLVTGCAAQTGPEAFGELPGVAAVIGRESKPGLARWPEAPGPGEPQAWPEFSISRFNRARPVLKIQDGCTHCCTYCIVPRARGPARSRPFGQIAAEAERLLEAGHREIILSGINLGQFDLGEEGGFWDMLSRLEAWLAPRWRGRARLRLSSLDPGMLGGRALEALGSSRMVCPHLHVSMQSADPGVLAAMGRAHYDPARVLSFLEELRRAWPMVAVGADLLTGFPGESEQAFEATRDFCAEARLAYAHVFPFSKRPGTVAAKAPGQLPNEEKKRRAALLRELTGRLEADHVAGLARLAELTVAVERENPGAGACEHYAECRLTGPSPVPAGMLLRVRPVGAEGTTVLAEPLNPC